MSSGNWIRRHRRIRNRFRVIHETGEDTAVWATCTSRRDSMRRPWTRIVNVLVASDSVGVYEDIVFTLLALQRFDQARQVIQEAQARQLDDSLLHSALYALAFLAADSPAMAKQQQWFAAQPEYENHVLSLTSD